MPNPNLNPGEMGRTGVSPVPLGVPPSEFRSLPHPSISPRAAVNGRSSHRLVRPHRSQQRRAGSVLLEVVLALALFVGAATVISTGINASIQTVQRLRLRTHAANLAISVMSELQMRARPAAPVGPEAFAAPFSDWLYRIVVSQEDDVLESDSLRAVEVIVWHPGEDVTQRLSQLFRATDLAAEGDESGVEAPLGETVP